MADDKAVTSRANTLLGKKKYTDSKRVLTKCVLLECFDYTGPVTVGPKESLKMLDPKLHCEISKTWKTRNHAKFSERCADFCRIPTIF